MVYHHFGESYEATYGRPTGAIQVKANHPCSPRAIWVAPWGLPYHKDTVNILTEAMTRFDANLLANRLVNTEVALHAPQLETKSIPIHFWEQAPDRGAVRTGKI